MMKRKEFVRKMTMSAVALSTLRYARGYEISPPENEIKEYLKRTIFPKDRLNPSSLKKYHPTFGWLMRNRMEQNGINNSWCVYTYADNDGERIMTNFANKSCRINTYGNSFTHCDQVSDNETWQEHLAAHIQEPVKNFGVGGWSVYQAYLRMLKEELRSPSELIIFTIFADDHLRNLDAWRRIRIRTNPSGLELTLPYLQVDLKNQQMRECENPCPTLESVYKLADLEEAYKLFKDDFVLKIMIAHEKSQYLNPDQQNEEIKKLLSSQQWLEYEVGNNETLSQTADKIHRDSALFASCRIIDKVEEFAKLNKRKILYVLAYPASYIIKFANGSKRWDSAFIEYLQEKNLPFVDLFNSHILEFSQQKNNIADYLKKYFIGHYNPKGNMFFAWEIINKVIEFLEPKPLPYK